MSAFINLFGSSNQTPSAQDGSTLLKLTSADVTTEVRLNLSFLTSLSPEFNKFSGLTEFKTKDPAAMRNFLEFVQRRAKQPTDPVTLATFHMLADEFKAEMISADLLDSINKFNFDNCLTVYSTLGAERLSAGTLAHINKVVLTNLSSLRNPKYIESVDKKMVNTFLLNEDNWPERGLYNLFNLTTVEDNLLALALNVYKAGDVKSEANEFVTMMSKIHFDALSQQSLVSISEHPFYADESVKADLGWRIAQEFVNIVKAVPRRKQRDTISHEKRLADELARVDAEEKAKLLTPTQIAELKVGDNIDVKDYQRQWYIGQVTDVNENAIGITFSGWEKSFDEKIDPKSNRFALRGAFTDGKLHVGTFGVNCGCTACRARFRYGFSCANPNCPVHGQKPSTTDAASTTTDTNTSTSDNMPKEV